MLRINLLPPEIIERRKYERFYPYVLIVAGVLTFAILAAWGYLQLVTSARLAELQSIEQTAADLRTQADSLAVFELKEQDLTRRQVAALTALADRIDMGAVAEEVSLVLPEEVWLSRLELHEPPRPGDPDQNVTESRFVGHAPNEGAKDGSNGFKSVASTMVRIASLTNTLFDVWLGSATAGSFDDFQGAAAGTGSVETVDFDISAQLRVPSASTVPGGVQ